MGRRLLSATSCLALATLFISVQAASAADLPAAPAFKAAPASPPLSWTGFYLGAGIGAGSFVLNNGNFDDRVTPTLPSQDTGGKGVLGTAIVGYDYQVHPLFVTGIFADGDWMDVRGEWRDRSGGLNVSGTVTQDWAWSVGGRFGYLATPGTLLFVSGGFTQTHLGQVDFTPFGGAAPTRFIPARTLDGWFIGAGAEAKMTQSVSLKLEYRYADFGNASVDRLVTGNGAFSTQVNEHLATQSVRFGINYRFN